VRTLPRAVTRLGALRMDELPAQGVLYLPKPYVVPGGMFNEMYGWDSYFIVLGLLADKKYDLARDMVENFLFEIAHYGGVLNANRSYLLSRSQPPLFGAMLHAVLDEAFAGDANGAREFLRRAYPLAVRDHDLWLAPEHRAGDTGLARYFDFGEGPVPEVGDAKDLQNAIRWLLAHPGERRADPDSAFLTGDAAQSCDAEKSKICAAAVVNGWRLSADFYRGDRAMRESGFDVSFRFGAYSGATHHYAPVCLNSLLYRYELDLAEFATRLGLPDEARRWKDMAATRRMAIDRWLWRANEGLYQDYDFVSGKSSHYAYVTAFYPLWAGAASPQQAQAVREHLALFERKGGLAMSTRVSGAQWDAPFGWAPTNWIAIAGLAAYGFNVDALRLAQKFDATIDRSFAADGTIREKYNMVSGNADVRVTTGYSANVIGFGWTNGVYLKLHELLETKH